MGSQTQWRWAAAEVRGLRRPPGRGARRVPGRGDRRLRRAPGLRGRRLRRVGRLRRRRAWRVRRRRLRRVRREREGRARLREVHGRGRGGEGACRVACGMRRYGTLGSQIGAGHVGLGYGAGPHGSGLGGAGGLAATIGTVGRVAGTSSNRLGGELEGWRVDHWWVGRGVGGRGSDRSPVPMYVRKPCGVVGCWLCLEVGPQGSGEGCGGRAGRRPAEALAAPRSAVSPAPTAATAR